MSAKKKAPTQLAPPVVRPSAKVASKNIIDETRTSVAATDALQPSQVETVEISSDEISDEEVTDDDNDNMQVDHSHTNGTTASALQQPPAVALVNGKQSRNDGAAEDGEAADDVDNEDTSPSFGELLRGNETIDVTSILQQPGTVDSTTRPTQTVMVPPPTHQSLTTVLTQALKTDDTDLLESCLHVNDLTTVQNTIERIDSSLAGTLLNKLAARLHRRPGRAGNLMTWVQWTLVAHGGALASQPKVVQSLNSLQKVLSERAKGLHSLLALKGKLDLLEKQMDLRHRMQQGRGLLSGGPGGDDQEDGEDVIWVEGESETTRRKDVNGSRSRRRQEAEEEEDDGAPDEVNGLDSEDEEEDSDEDGHDSDGAAAEESLDENEVDHNDVEDSESAGEEEESDEETAAPPTKVQKVAKSFSKKK